MSRPIQLVIFGASGDLTSRKLIPALLASAAEGSLPALQVVGVSRSERSSDDWRAELAQRVPEHLRDAWTALAPSVHWLAADASKTSEVRRLGFALDDLLASQGGDRERSGRLYYLALRPRLFAPVIQALSSQGLLKCPAAADQSDEGWRRVIIEKPFGTDLETARALNRELLTHLREDQIFRIDHYLGKETVQNLLTLRFQNAIFEPLWHRQHVESVEISVCETVAMEGKRGAYYDHAGALRDMVQNHLLQVLALTAMEAPASLSAHAIRNEKVKVLQALRPFTPERTLTDTVRAQYAEGPARDTAYRDEAGVAADSSTETFAAVRAYIDNWRWSGVPFLLRTGKALSKRYTEVVLRMRTPPIDLANGPLPDGACAMRPNDVRILIQPQEGVRVSFLVKQPGAGLTMRHAELGFDYSDMGVDHTPPAYQRLLLDALEGNAALFIRGDEVEAAWTFVDSLYAGWSAADAPVHTYPAGSWGPEAADELFRGCEGIWGVGP